ncbi:glycosyltransferase involved in cell wall biosynthesis [Desulfosalsimonas propionicica]|uniref:Glycosyltransferase involved in cell wall biosynthesis n=1 Tax=Desulfosalsimonas propionicica TaxID=332175 RepID=A0A7W0C6D4_9BACT|nr:glycosyltransferase family 2 protein [Desulfosalsimonas propionicica]MBA2879999.1 glycosyltransferase involved in cell wall biosynthesis [Desulfosalsimonas propionicica]
MMISVVIPSYKRHDLLLRAVKSVLSQTLPPYEIIVSNDGPDREKAELLSSLDYDHLKYIEAPRSGKASVTRNFGIGCAKGDWIALLDDDDIWLPTKLEVQFNYLEKQNNKNAIIAGIEMVYAPSGRIWRRPKGNFQGMIKSSDAVLNRKGGFNTSTIVAPRHIFLKYPFNEKINKLEDVEWVLSAGIELNTCIPPEPVCVRIVTEKDGLSQPGGFETVWAWYLRNKEKMTIQSRCYSITDILARRASYDFNWQAYLVLVRELHKENVLNFMNICRLTSYFVAPQQVRIFIKKLI